MEVRKITIIIGDVQVIVVLNCSHTAELVWCSMPIKSSAKVWGDEVYFSTDLEAEDENPQDVVGLGDVGYWHPGQAICLFFGLTPMSRVDEIRPASPVNVLGCIEGDSTVLKSVRDGQDLLVKRIE